MERLQSFEATNSLKLEQKREQKLAQKLMDGFAKNTGLVGKAPNHRYLYTDAIAVQNFLRLAQLSYGDTSSNRYTELAKILIEKVHETLGRHRDDDERSGWLSGLPDNEARRHPTIAGLRIGKSLPERERDEALNPSKEWDRDGQYFHYLTRWTDALLDAGKILKEKKYIIWASELMLTATKAFVNQAPNPGMYWKMSIDLMWPQINNMGAHDPLEGLLTAKRLEYALPEKRLEFNKASESYEQICFGKNWSTLDPLGLGFLLIDVGKRMKLPRNSLPSHFSSDKLLADAMAGLEAYSRTNELSKVDPGRLAFRECGLSMGIRAMEYLEEIEPFVPIADQIENFWKSSAARGSESYLAHGDINDVSLAASLCRPFF